MVIASLSAADTSVPETGEAVKAHMAAVNAAGGINGAKVEVEVCDDKNEPNTAAACARQAVNDKVVATVGDFSIQGESVWPALVAAGIPRIGLRSITPTDGKSPLSFPVDGTTTTGYQALASLLAEQQHCKGIAVVASPDSAAAHAIADAVKATVEKANLKFAGVEYLPASGPPPDLTPVATQLVRSGADCTVIVSSGTLQAQISQAFLSVAPDMKFGAQATGMPADWPKALPTVEHYTVIDAFAPQNGDAPGMTAFHNEMSQHSPGAKLTGLAVRSWIAAKVFESVAKTIKGDITASAMVAALEKAAAVDTGGVTAPIDFTTPKTVGTVTRLFNTRYLQLRAKNGEVVAAGEFFDAYQP